MTPLAYRISQCRDARCRKYLTFPILTHEEWIHWSLSDFNHCGRPTEFVRIMGREEYEIGLNEPFKLEPVGCDGSD